MATLGERILRIQKRDKISGDELARRLDISSSDYHNKLKKSKEFPTTAWRIALQALDQHGSKWVKPLKLSEKRPKREKRKNNEETL